MVQRASLRRGQVFIDGVDFKRFAEGLGKALADKHQLNIGLGQLMELTAKAAGFKSMRDLKILAESNLNPDEPAFGPKAGRFEGLDGRRLAEARQQFLRALDELKISGAIGLVVCGASHDALQSVVRDVIKRADAAKFDLRVALKGDLEMFERSTSRLVVLDRVSADDPSYLWAKAFAERHREKTVVILMEEVDSGRLLSPVNELPNASMVCLDLTQRQIRPEVIRHASAGASGRADVQDARQGA